MELWWAERMINAVAVPLVRELVRQLGPILRRAA